MVLIAHRAGAALGALVLASGASAQVAPDPPPPTPALFPAGVPLDPGPPPGGLDDLSAQVCNACHFAIHDGWIASAHRAGARLARVREAAEASGQGPACLACHLPLLAQHREVLAAVPEGELGEPVLEPNPAWRPALEAEGVTCAACHVRAGTVLGPYGRDHAPHPVTVTRELSDPAFCATCHQLAWKDGEEAVYDTFGEWQRSRWAAAGVRCQDCHMPPVAGPSTQGRFAAVADHRVRADLARALTLEVLLPPEGAVRGQRLDGELVVRNTGAGHAVPTGSPFKAVQVEVRFLDGRGRQVGDAVVERWRRQVTDAPPFATVEDNRLLPGQARRVPLSFDIPHKVAAGRAAVQVTLRRVDAAGQEGPPEVERSYGIPLR